MPQLGHGRNTAGEEGGHLGSVERHRAGVILGFKLKTGIVDVDRTKGCSLKNAPHDRLALPLVGVAEDGLA